MLNAKYKVEKMFLKQVFNYLQKNPDENLEKIMKWIRKFDTEHLWFVVHIELYTVLIVKSICNLFLLYTVSSQIVLYV